MKSAKIMTDEHNSITELNRSEQDKQNYRAFLNGDQKAFEALVIKHKDHLIYFINRMINNVTISEDIAQDAFVEVLLHKERYNFTISFKTYLFTIGRNKAIDYIRKNKRIMLIDEFPDEVSQENGLENLVIQGEEERLLYRMMKELKQEYQQAIMLIDLEELSYAQASQVLGKSDSQMKVLIHRARKSLAKLMEREGFTYEK